MDSDARTYRVDALHLTDAQYARLVAALAPVLAAERAAMTDAERVALDAWYARPAEDPGD